MKANEKLLFAIGNVDERFIYEYTQSQKSTRHAPRLGLRLFALAAAVVMVLTGTVMATDSDAEWVQALNTQIAALSSHFNALDTEYLTPVNQTQSIVIPNGTYDYKTNTFSDEKLTMEVYNVVVEEHHLLVACNYSFTDGGENEAVQTSDWSWDITLSQNGEVIFQNNDGENFRTSSYTLPDGQDAVLYDIPMTDMEGERLLNQETTLNFYMNEPGDGYFFTFTAEKCYQERNYQVNRTFTVKDMHGDSHDVTITDIYEDALYYYITMEDDGFTDALYHQNGQGYCYEYELVDSDGLGYSIDQPVPKPEKAGKSLTLRVVQCPVVEDLEIDNSSLPAEVVVFETVVRLK
jgi:hypothetical protein